MSLRTTLAAGVVAASVVPVWAGAPAYADHEAPCSADEVPTSEPLADTHAKDNPAFDRMHVEQAQALARGAGTKVAVIDSGVMPVRGLDRPTAVAVGGASGDGLLSGHGTIVAGLIAGPHGVAPDAEVHDYKVFDSETADPADVSPGRHEVDVAPSVGAYVLAGSDASADGGTPYVIDTKGEKYLIGPQVSEFIGYADVDPPLVPSTWLEFFEPGVPLTTNSARRMPEDAAPPSDAEEDAGS